MLGISLKNKHWEACVPYFLVIALFFIPISSSLKSVFIVVAASAILLTPAYRKSLSFILTQDWCLAAIALFLVVLAGCFWSLADYHARLLFIEKYSKLLYLPIFAIGFQKATIRNIAIRVFLLAMAITCLFSFFNHFQQVNNNGRLFHDHISTGCMMALAAYLSGLLATNFQGVKRLLWLLLSLVFSYQVIFINTGRIGYIIYFVLMMMLLIQALSWKHVVAGIAAFCILFFACSYQSVTLQNRLQQAITDWKQYQQGEKETSVGMRLVFHNHAKSMFLSSPWVGHGTGSFSRSYQKINTAPTYSNIMEPHSQYWLIASEFGLLGLTALFYFFSILVINAFRLHDMKPVMLGLLVCFFLSNLSDSQLLHSDIGYLFIVFSGLCLGERVEKRRMYAANLSEQNMPSMFKAVIQ